MFVSVYVFVFACGQLLVLDIEPCYSCSFILCYIKFHSGRTKKKAVAGRHEAPKAAILGLRVLQRTGSTTAAPGRLSLIPSVER